MSEGDDSDYESCETEDSEYSPLSVGDVVLLDRDANKVEDAFYEVPFTWEPDMAPMCGQSFKVLEVVDDMVVGLESANGEQDNVWYFPVSVLTLTFKKDEEGLIMHYAVSMGKGLAGAVKLACEDVLQLFCQVIFLIKKWKFLSQNMKIYTMASIGAGLTLALLGPVKEYISMKRMQAQARAIGGSLENSLGLDADNAAKADSTAKAVGSGRLTYLDAGEGTYTLRDTSIVELVTGKGYMKKHSQQVHRVLVGAATFYWCLMLVLYLVDPPSCGEQTPRWKWMLFPASCAVNFVAQLWVALHGRQGYKVFIFKFQHILFGTFLSVLGCFDTFSDIGFTAMIGDCDAITWFSIHDKIFHIPFGLSLQTIAHSALIVGVFACQAIPGIFFLCRRQWLPMTLKMNEFTLLLTVMEFETDME